LFPALDFWPASGSRKTIADERVVRSEPGAAWLQKTSSGLLGSSIRRGTISSYDKQGRMRGISMREESLILIATTRMA